MVKIIHELLAKEGIISVAIFINSDLSLKVLIDINSSKIIIIHIINNDPNSKNHGNKF
jgi:hypothetical protein